jgi:type 2A phosphatase activator TIP41
MQAPEQQHAATCSDSFSVGGWTVVISKGPIMCSAELQQAESSLTLKMPEMVFGKNVLQLHNADANVSLRFDALHALSCVALEPWLQVAGADQWAGGSALEVKEAGKLGSEPAPTYDWTYSSAFPGALRPSGHDWSKLPFAVSTEQLERGGCLAGSRLTEQTMNIALLQPRDDCPILFNDEVLLYQDELHDNGDSIFSIKIRCTPKYIYVLSRNFLRVDGVLFNSLENRILIEFGARHICHSFTHKRDTFSAVVKRFGSEEAAAEGMRNLDLLTSQLPVQRTQHFLVDLPYC